MTTYNEPATSPETALALWVAAGMAAYGLWVGYKRLSAGSTTPDPWSPELTASLNEGHGVPLCVQCLEPHDEYGHLCTHCGSVVGQCTSLMPPLYYLGLGQILRTGTTGDFSPTPWRILGYVLVSGFAYLCLTPLVILLPVYWIMLLLNVGRLWHDHPPDPTPESN